MAADGSDVRQVTDTPGDQLFPFWLPGGKRIVFQEVRDGNVEIFSIRTDGTGVRRLTRNDVADRLVWD